MRILRELCKSSSVFGLAGLAFVVTTSVSSAQLFQESDLPESTQEQAAENTVTNQARVVTSRVTQAVKAAYSPFGFTPPTGGTPANAEPIETTVLGADGHGSITDGVGVWGNASYDYLRQAPQDFESKIATVVGAVGADKFFTDQILAGVAISTGKTTGDTLARRFAAGNNPISNLDLRSRGISAYGAYVFSPIFYVDVSTGWSQERYKTSTVLDTTLALNNQFEQTGYSWFASTNAYVNHQLNDNTLLTGQLGVLRTYSDIGDTTDDVTGGNISSTQVGVTVFSLGGQASYLLLENVVLYGGATAELFGKDQVVGLGEGVAGESGLVDQQTTTRAQGRFTLGADLFASENLTLSTEGGLVAFRDDSEGWNFGINARYDF